MNTAKNLSIVWPPIPVFHPDALSIKTRNKIIELSTKHPNFGKQRLIGQLNMEGVLVECYLLAYAICRLYGKISKDGWAGFLFLTLLGKLYIQIESRCRVGLKGNPVGIGSGPAAVIGDEIRIRPLSVPCLY